jgi:tetratricopeptide (TPR) repeat protein
MEQSGDEATAADVTQSSSTRCLAMSSQTVSCPNCRVVLRTNKPLTAARMMRCPQCGHQFLVPAPDQFTLEPAHNLDDLTPVGDEGQPRRIPGWVLAAAAAVLLVSTGLFATLYLTRENPAPPVAQDDDKKRHDEEKRLAEEKLKLAEEQTKLEKEKQRKLQFSLLMADGEAALLKKQYSDAERAFSAALDLNPDDAAARAGLVKAKTAVATEANTAEDKAKRQAEYARLMELGKDKMTAKEYAAAKRAFEEALLYLAGDVAAQQGLNEANDALDKDKAQQQKLADYKTRMEAGRAAMVNERFADAVREYQAALLIIPGDVAATRALGNAEQRVGAIQDREKRRAAFLQLVDRGNAALQGKRYDEAVREFTAALKLYPEDLEAQTGLRNAKKAQGDGKADYTRIMAQANNAFQLQRYEEAYQLYRDANRLFPDDEAAKKGLQDVQVFVEKLQAAAVAYTRYMTAGNLAMQKGRYLEAATAFTEALRLTPNDPDAAQGLAAAQAAINKELKRKKELEQLVLNIKTSLQQQQYADAEKSANAALALDSDNVLVQGLLHQARYGRFMAEADKARNAKRYNDAIQFYQQALTEQPGDLRATNLLQQTKFAAKNMK